MKAWSAFWVLLSTGCGGDSLGCAGKTAPDCTVMEAGLGRDACFATQLKGLVATDVNAVESVSHQISDPLVQQEAVSTWVGMHVGELSREDGARLCGLLTGRDAAYCLRRLSSPHLQR